MPRTHTASVCCAFANALTVSVTPRFAPAVCTRKLYHP